MTIITSDPLAFLIGQGGMVGTPLLEAAANGARKLDVQQRGAVIGEPISIVFCRRISGVGGVLISPPATEARFQNSLTNEVTAFYHLVLGEGQMNSIQVRDVFQRSCRVGSFTQTYNKRAGTFIPGNFIVARSGYTTPECPSYCGTGGRYTGLSTMTHQATYPDGVDQWNRQVHCFIRGGIYVTRLLDSTLGPSNNVADLLLYLLRNSSRVPEAQIDTTSLMAGATFTNTNGFWFNGEVNTSTNVRDWIDSTLQYFLLRQARVAGKEAVSPLLPVNTNGTIKTTAVGWEFTFTEQHIVPDSFEITYTSLADRKPFCALMLWRQQDDNGIGIIRTAEVRYAGTAADGPFEQHDLSAFCASENHAVKVGAYILSRRRHITHRLRIAAKPDAFNGTLAAGDLVRVRLDRIASTGANSRHDYLYEVDRIGKSLTGEVQLELTHFPIDGNLASVVAQEVNAATGAGLILPTGLSGVTCDVNSSGDTSVPSDTSLDPGDWDLSWDPFENGSYGTSDFDYDISAINPIDTNGFESELPEAWTSTSGIGGIGGFGGIGSSGGGGGYGNPTSGADGQSPTTPPTAGLIYSGDSDTPRVGDTATVDGPICEGGIVEWWRLTPEGSTVALDPDDPSGDLIFQNSTTYTFVIDDVDYKVFTTVKCPDPSSPTGYGPRIPWVLTERVYPQPALPDANVYGTYSPTGSTTIIATNEWLGNWSTNNCSEYSYPFGGGTPSTNTLTVMGVQAMRFVGSGSGGCEGFFKVEIEVQNAAGVWFGLADISGGGVGWKKYVGSIQMSSTAPDAIPAYLGNFGGESTPP